MNTRDTLTAQDYFEFLSSKEAIAQASSRFEIVMEKARLLAVLDHLEHCMTLKARRK